MARNLKALGLALAAVLALGAVTASGASAQGKLTTASSVTLKATQNPGGINALTSGGVTKCKDAFYTAHKITTTPHVAIPAGATEVTVTPHYGTCLTEDTFPTTVDMNGCDYTFKLGATTGGVAHTYGITAGVVCPANKDIVVTVGTGADPHNTVWCHVTIEYEAGKHYSGLHATDLTDGTVRIHGTATGFKTIKTKPLAPLKEHPTLFPCSGTSTTSELHIDVIAASSPAGTAVVLSH